MVAVKRSPRVSTGPIRTKREDRIRAAAVRRRSPEVTPAQAEAARARLDPLYGAVIVEDDPLAPDAYLYADLDYDCRVFDPILRARADADSKKRRRKATPAAVTTAHAAAPVAPRSDSLAPCPRCGRVDWQTANGRQWHLDNYAECAAQRKPERHQYQEVTAA